MRSRFRVVVALLVSAFAGPVWAAAPGCTIAKVAELPVTMDGMGPMIDAKIDGTPARLVADSGAFFSILSPGAAQALHLTVKPIRGALVRGVGGDMTVGAVVADSLSLAGTDLPHAHFLVGGSEVNGAGVIGQDILGFADVEYDLPHGVIRLLRSDGCGSANLAYWSAGRTFAVVKIAPRSAYNPHTVGTVFINGKPIRATFDTGAATTILSLAAAARIGLRPDSPGVTDGGGAIGFGRHVERTWIGPVQTIAIGDGEQIQHARIRFGALGDDFDMLIGADFFIAHRVYVDNKQHRLFLTYEGGPVFNLKTRYDAPGSDAAKAVAAAPAGPPAGADALSREGAVALARDDLDAAVASFSRAIDAAPNEPRYRQQRATAYFRQHKDALGLADLDAVIRLAPADVDARLAHASALLERHNEDGAVADLDAADRAADPSAMQRLAIGGLLVEAGQPQRAIPQFDRWLKAHPDDVRRTPALNGRCWARALAGVALDAALQDCNAALRLAPGAPDILDSRGIVELRQGNLRGARSDFDAALAKAPKLPWSLYGRGAIKLRGGDRSGARRTSPRRSPSAPPSGATRPATASPSSRRSRAGPRARAHRRHRRPERDQRRALLQSERGSANRNTTREGA